MGSNREKSNIAIAILEKLIKIYKSRSLTMNVMKNIKSIWV